MKNGFVVHEGSNIHLLGEKRRRRNETFVCSSEIADSKKPRQGLQSLVEDHLEYLLQQPAPLCVFKEFPCGNGGSVDFLAINRDGLVFLIEVKRAKDQRAKYDVIFQVLKYHCFPSEILQQLSQSCLEPKLIETWNLTQAEAAALAERVRKNVENRLMNPVVVVDEASYPLIAHAYSLALRDIEGELRVIEINSQVITPDQGKPLELVYIRKYFSNDTWIGNAVVNNRRPTEFILLPDKLAEIPDETIRHMVVRLLEKAEIKVPKVAKRVMSFKLVSGQAHSYFSFDPDGSFCWGGWPRTNPPKNPYRIVVAGANTDQDLNLAKGGFIPVSSHDKSCTYRVFELVATTTEQELDRVASVLRALKRQ